MRTTEQNEKIHELATAILKRRGVASPTFAEYADAAEIAADAFDKGKTTLAGVLAVGAIGDGTADAQTVGVLAKFANEGRFVTDHSLGQRDLLEAVIAAEKGAGGETIFTAEAESPVCAHGYPGGKGDGCPYCP